MWGEHHWTVRFNFCRMLTYNFRVCVLSLHTAVPKKNCSNLQVLWVLWLAPPVYLSDAPLWKRLQFLSRPKIGVGIIHIRPWLEVLGPLIGWFKKKNRNWGHWLPNKSELWSRPNTRTNKFNTNEAIKVIKDGCKIQFLFHWMVQLSWLLLG